MAQRADALKERIAGARLRALFRAFCLSLTLLVLAVPAARAAQLVVFVRDGCPWCDRFEAEIAPVYPQTAESRCAPLRRVNLDRARPADLTGIKGIVYTPTFVVFEDGREVGRVNGYPGDIFFWDLLGEQLAKLHIPCSTH